MQNLPGALSDFVKRLEEEGKQPVVHRVGTLLARETARSRLILPHPEIKAARWTGGR